MIKLNRALKSFSGDFCLYDMGANLRCQEEAIPRRSAGWLVARFPKGNKKETWNKEQPRPWNAWNERKKARGPRFLFGSWLLASSLKLALPGKGHARSRKTELGGKAHDG